VDSLNHIETIEALPSLRSLEVYPDFQPGRDVRKTTDIRCVSRCGAVLMKAGCFLGNDFQL
jgi:hypothetical protein